jgi:hypothetical protein
MLRAGYKAGRLRDATSYEASAAIQNGINT